MKLLDIYGPTVQLTYKNRESYQSRAGAIATCLAIVAFTIYFVVQTEKLVTGRDPYFSMMTITNDESRIDMQKLSFFFAIE